MSLRILIISLAAALFVSSCGEVGSYDNLPETGAASSISDVSPPRAIVRQGRDELLAAGDVVKLEYPGAPQFNQIQKIRRNNQLSLPMIGEVRAGGLKLKDFQAGLAGRYAKHLQNPNVSVSMHETSATVYVSGHVQRPKKIVLDRPMTALEAVMEAGGFHKFGSPKKVTLVRNQNGGYQSYRLNLDAAMKGQAKPFPLQPNDVITVR